MMEKQQPVVRRSSPWKLVGIAAICIGAACVGASAQDQGEWKLVVTPEQTEAARVAGAAHGAAAGGPFTLPTDKKIGLILLSAQSSSTFRILNPIRELSEKFGFSVITCDPNFDAQKVAQCATSMVAQNADAVFSISTSPGPMGSALADAAERGIKWFGVLSGTEPSPFIIPYGNTGHASGRLSAEWLFEEGARRRGENSQLKFTIFTAPTVGLANLIEEQEVLAAAAERPNVEIVINHTLDLANIVQDTLSMTARALQQHPDLAGYWTVCDLCVPLIAQAVASTGIPEDRRPIISGDFTTPQSVALLREGRIDMLMDIPFEGSVWAAFDQLLAYWSRGAEINTSADVFRSGYGIELMKPYLLTRENIGSEGAIPVYGDADFRTYFLEKWKLEYGLD